LSPPALAAASVHTSSLTTTSYSICLTLASSFLSLRLLPLAVQLAHACSVLWPDVPPPPTDLKGCAASLQQCLAAAITCDASPAMQAQHAVTGSITQKLHQPLCALPALLMYVSLFSRMPLPSSSSIMQGARACASSSLFHCAHLLLTRFPANANPASPCLVTWTAIMSLRLPPPPFPPHMFAPHCIPPLLLLAQGSQGLGGTAAHAMVGLWPRPLPPSPFHWRIYGETTNDAVSQRLAVMQAPSPLPLLLALTEFD
jgi:hypothetical protein